VGRLGEYIAKLQQVTEEDVNESLLQIIRDHEEVITNMNTDQLWEGERPDGSMLPDYSPTSVQVFGKPEGPIRLFDQGDFYRGIFLDADQFPVMFEGRDEKTEMLKSDYGAILGINEENLRELNQSYLKDEILSYFARILSPL